MTYKPQNFHSALHASKNLNLSIALVDSGADVHVRTEESITMDPARNCLFSLIKSEEKLLELVDRWGERFILTKKPVPDCYTLLDLCIGISFILSLTIRKKMGEGRFDPFRER